MSRCLYELTPTPTSTMRQAAEVFASVYFDEPRQIDAFMTETMDRSTFTLKGDPDTYTVRYFSDDPNRYEIWRTHAQPNPS